MTVEESWVDAMRATALAKLLLTERGDIEIIDEPPGRGYDLLVRVHTAESAVIPEFAVEVKGTRGRITTRKLRDWLTGMRAPKSAKEWPLCLFVFQVESRKGMYCWLQEPVVVKDTAMIRSVWEPRSLSGNHDRSNLLLPPLSPLDERALDAIVSRVIAWTQTFERRLDHQVRAS
jgi:hypothetical protein